MFNHEGCFRIPNETPDIGKYEFLQESASFELVGIIHIFTPDYCRIFHLI